YLGIYMLVAAEDRQPGAHLGALQFSSYAFFSLEPGDVARICAACCHLRSLRSYFLEPVLPTLRRTCTPEYRIPLPLYGSTGLRARIRAAVSPRTSISIPSSRTTLDLSTLAVIPSGSGN